jgi:hypothetical protein
MTAPRKNTGIETPISANTVRLRSSQWPARHALSMPNRIPIDSQMMPAPIASEAVTGRRIQS